jgi:CBS domain-containing protein
MTTTIVRDVMSPDLVYVTEGGHASLVLPQILRFGITAVPVLDRDHRPVGVVSLRDLVAGSDLEASMTAPAQAIAETASIEDAARALARTDYHHFVVVGTDGKAVGMVSSLDLLRATLGLPARHPAALHDVAASPRVAH